eukprot:Protomagalhaensia_wolfi_Nauph_80__5519@NODE_605_length_2222_cov_10_726065_g453_i0_p3_GENE_NODE_605_length_2222_cov_10_726065_g453_i0NODE_605_length_2222_cov_10_726065_g453_i0_p3_ORF_typecomplete_len126_score5_30Nuclease_act/PF08133_11/0_062_NODE_605_length_2222_cov_10_726065_g453_i017012078
MDLSLVYGIGVACRVVERNSAWNQIRTSALACPCESRGVAFIKNIDSLHKKSGRVLIALTLHRTSTVHVAQNFNTQNFNNSEESNNCEGYTPRWLPPNDETSNHNSHILQWCRNAHVVVVMFGSL